MCNLMEVIANLVHEYGAEPTLRSEIWLDEIMLTADYGIAHWRSDPQVDIELRLFLLQIVGKTPLLFDLPMEKQNAEHQFLTSEFFIEGMPEIKVPSAGAAMLLGDVLSSILSAEKWGNPELEILQRCLNPENGNGYIETRAIIPHVSHPDHTEPVGRWLQNVLRSEVNKPDELWADRSELFPNIEFCVEVEDQLYQLQPGIFRAVLDRLADLDESARRWREQQTHQPVYGFWTHPESPATLQKYGHQRRFSRANGSIIQFSLHTRFPGEGRIYFYPDRLQYIFIVGYVGSHLDTVRFN